MNTELKMAICTSAIIGVILSVFFVCLFWYQWHWICNQSGLPAELWILAEWSDSECNWYRPKFR